MGPNPVLSHRISVPLGLGMPGQSTVLHGIVMLQNAVLPAGRCFASDLQPLRSDPKMPPFARFPPSHSTGRAQTLRALGPGEGGTVQCMGRVPQKCHFFAEKNRAGGESLPVPASLGCFSMHTCPAPNRSGVAWGGVAKGQRQQHPHPAQKRGIFGIFPSCRRERGDPAVPGRWGGAVVALVVL